jgi:parallel beta-helix repeat protein
MMVYGSLNDFVGNAIIHNGIGQATDDGSANFWDDGISEGNHWSNYNGSGVYQIDGSAGSVDNYPVLDFGRGPLLDTPDDLTISVPTAVSWVAYDSDPYEYNIWVDGSINTTKSWDGDRINYLVQGIASGLHNVTVEVFDTGGNRTIDTVWVHCLVDILPSDYPDFIPRDPLFIGGDEDSQWREFSGYGTEDSPYVIKDFIFDLTDTGEFACIKLYNLDTVYVIVRNCIFQGTTEEWPGDPPMVTVTGTGVDVQRSGNVTITNCTFQTIFRGISTLDSSGCTFEDNTFHGNPYGVPLNYGAIGIKLDINTGHSSNFIVRDNRIEMCSSGIQLYHTNESLFQNNYVHSSDTGLSVDSSSNYNHIESNNFSYNTFDGISIMDCSYNTITFNNCTHNGHAGIQVDSSVNNQITENDFSFNEYGAWDDSLTPNFFDYNMYSDYTGVDENGDGIGDTPHTIPGEAGAVDQHPRVTLGDVIITTSSTTTSTQEGGYELQTVTLIIAGAGIVTILLVALIANKSRRYG